MDLISTVTEGLFCCLWSLSSPLVDDDNTRFRCEENNE